MKKLALALSATALFALSACDTEATDTTDDTVTTAEETVVAEEPADTAVVDGEETDGDSVSISEDGMTADINDGDTSVNADVSEDPSLDVEVN